MEKSKKDQITCGQFKHAGIFGSHEEEITCLSSVSENSESFALSGSTDKTLVKWIVDSDFIRGEWDDSSEIGFPQSTLKKHRHFVTDCTLTPDGKYAISVSHDNQIILWNLEEGNIKEEAVSELNSQITCIKISDDKRYIIVGHANGQMQLWNTLLIMKLDIAEENKKLGKVNCIEFFGENMIVSGHESGSLQTFTLGSPESINSFPAHEGEVLSMASAYFGKEKRIMTGGKDGEVKLWNPKFEGLDIIWSLSQPIVCLSLSRRGFVAAGFGKSLAIWSLKQEGGSLPEGLMSSGILTNHFFFTCEHKDQKCMKRKKNAWP